MDIAAISVPEIVQSSDSRLLDDINFQKQYTVQPMINPQTLSMKIQASGVMV